MDFLRFENFDFAAAPDKTVWLHHDYVPIIGTVVNDGEEFIFLATWNSPTGDPLYLFALPAPELLQAALNSEIPFRDVLLNPETLLYREYQQEDEKIKVLPLDGATLTEMELPTPLFYLNMS